GGEGRGGGGGVRAVRQGGAEVTWWIAGGVVLALASAAALNWGYYAQHGAAAALPPLSLRQPMRSLAALFGSRRWLLGFWTGIAGWVLYVVALTLAPLSLVQACAAGGLAILAALAGVRSRRGRVPRAAAPPGPGGVAPVPARPRARSRPPNPPPPGRLRGRARPGAPR